MTPFAKTAITATAALLVAAGPAKATDINALVTTAMKAAVDQLVPKFEQDQHHVVHLTYGPSGGLAKRLNNGEAADMILVASPTLDGLIKQGKVKPERTEISRTGIAICVRKGAPKPDVSTPEALKKALLAAKSIAHTAPAGGGITALHIQQVFVRLGIDKEVTPKVKLAAGGPNGRVSTLVEDGTAEIGLQQLSELMSNPNVEVIGMLPDSLQQITIHTAGVTTTAKQPDAARALIQFLAAPDAIALYKKTGLAL